MISSTFLKRIRLLMVSYNITIPEKCEEIRFFNTILFELCSLIAALQGSKSLKFAYNLIEASLHTQR